MEFLLELIMELVLDGAIEAAHDKQLPRIVRIVGAVVSSILFGGLGIAFLLIAVSSESLPLRLILTALTVLFAVLLIRMWVRIMRR